MDQGSIMHDPFNEADQARERVAATIDALQERLDPRRILGEAVGKVQLQGSEIAGQARDLLKAHPLAIGAVGAAIGLALFTRSKLAGATVNLGDDYAGYTDYDDNFGAEVAPQRIYDDETAEDILPPTARRPALSSDTIAASPVVSIVAGLVAGAILGALFPATENETRIIGESGARLSRAARAAARTAKAELEAHGLSIDAATRAATHARDSVRNVVGAATGEWRDRPAE